MGFQASPLLVALLATIAITHQTGHAQISHLVVLDLDIGFPSIPGLFKRAISTCTSSTTMLLTGKGSDFTTRITSSTFALIRVAIVHCAYWRLDRNRAGRYHKWERRLLRRSRRSCIFSLISRRCWISAASSTFPLPTQARPVTLLPLSMPQVTSATCPSHCQHNWMVKGR